MGKQSSVAVAKSDLKMVNHGIAQLEHFLNSREFFQLPRKDLISALQGIREVLLVIEAKFAKLNQIDADKKKLNAKHSSSDKKQTNFIMLCAFVVAVAAGVQFSSWIVGIIAFFATGVIATIMFASGDKFDSMEIKPLEEKKAELNREIDDIMSSAGVGWLLSNTLSADYMNSHAVGMFAKYLDAGRADSLKEAINLYEEEQHRGRMESMQQANVFAAQAAAFHSFQTSMRSGDIARDVKKIRQVITHEPRP